jgi:hypothetical protein
VNNCVRLRVIVAGIRWRDREIERRGFVYYCAIARCYNLTAIPHRRAMTNPVHGLVEDLCCRVTKGTELPLRAAKPVHLAETSEVWDR